MLQLRNPLPLLIFAAAAAGGCGGSSGGGSPPPEITNSAPAISTTVSAPSTVTSGEYFAIGLTATDPDGDALSFSGIQMPTWLTLTDNGNGSATLSGEPLDSDAGVHAFTIEVSDNQFPPGKDTIDFTIEVSLPLLVDLDFRDEVIYWAFTDRFANGDTGNDNGDLSRAGDAADPSNPLGWHGGDFKGIEQKIQEGYFQRMGFTAIWISPVQFQIPPVGNGGGPNANRIFVAYHAYWAEDFQAIEPHFGTLADLQSLVATAHANDMKIIIDLVLNHAGYGANLVSANPDWFRTGSECGNDEVTLCLAGLPDFVHENPAVVDFLNDAVFWLRDETGLDGVRMDTMKHVNDSYWEQFFVRGGAGDPSQLWTVGEVFDGDISKLARFMDDLGSPSVFDFPLKFAMTESVAGGGSIAPIRDVFAQDVRYQDPTKLSLFLDNHDVKRFMSEAIDSGIDRDTALVRLDAALSFMYFVRGVPVVYYGTEIGMEGQGDPYGLPLGESNREDMQFFQVGASTIDELLGDLAAARVSYPALRRGTQRTIWPVAGAGCSPNASALDPSAAFGRELFVRGLFNGWAAAPGISNVVNEGNGIFAAQLEISAGGSEYKIAADDWSVEVGVPDGATVVGTTQGLDFLMGGGDGNAFVDIPADGCYRWEIDVANPAARTLTITEIDGGGVSELLAIAREMDGEMAVVAVLNNSTSSVLLGDLDGGGIQVGDLFPDGPVQEITGRGAGFQVVGGRLTGTIPAKASRAFASANGQ